VSLFTNNRLWIFLFQENTEPRSWRQVVAWWELRRIPFNIILLVLGLPSLFLFYWFVSHSGQLKPGEDAVESLSLFAAPLIANFFYTGGWVIELVLRQYMPNKHPKYGPFLFKCGLVFSAIVILLPTFIWFLAFIFKIKV
jgi:hypothetical protein